MIKGARDLEVNYQLTSLALNFISKELGYLLARRVSIKSRHVFALGVNGGL
jgi:hypothetical protein